MNQTSNDQEPAPEISLLLRALDEGYEAAAWHGPNLLGSIRRVGVGEAAWRPADGQRNVWEIVVHAAYWKYVVWRRLRGETRGGFPRKGSDWFPCPPADAARSAAATAAAWKADVALLDEMHRKLRAAVAETPPGDLHKTVSGGMSNAGFIRGAAAHDVYHAGQIQTLRQLYRRAAKGATGEAEPPAASG